MKAEKIILDDYISQLNDWEVLSSCIFCSKILSRKTEILNNEFLDFSFFFFDNDEEQTRIKFEETRDLYFNEYQKRHNN